MVNIAKPRDILAEMAPADAAF
jgi:hypothetical protein